MIVTVGVIIKTESKKPQLMLGLCPSKSLHPKESNVLPERGAVLGASFLYISRFRVCRIHQRGSILAIYIGWLWGIGGCTKQA